VKLSLEENPDPIGYHDRLIEIRRNPEHRDPGFARTLYPRKQLSPRYDVDAISRFVKYQEAWRN
jgi:hypothetical protein